MNSDIINIIRIVQDTLDSVKEFNSQLCEFLNHTNDRQGIRTTEEDLNQRSRYQPAKERFLKCVSAFNTMSNMLKLCPREEMTSEYLKPHERK